jgi:hypothetical protein
MAVLTKVTAVLLVPDYTAKVFVSEITTVILVPQ